jgi:hypothetical protein
MDISSNNDFIYNFRQGVRNIHVDMTLARDRSCPRVNRQADFGCSGISACGASVGAFGFEAPRTRLCRQLIAKKQKPT